MENVYREAKRANDFTTGKPLGRSSFRTSYSASCRKYPTIDHHAEHLGWRIVAAIAHQERNFTKTSHLYGNPGLGMMGMVRTSNNARFSSSFLMMAGKEYRTLRQRNDQRHLLP
jgi:hypothetical protein